MRATWLVLGVLVAGGAVAYVKIRETPPSGGKGGSTPSPTPAKRTEPIRLQREERTPPRPDASTDPEAKATALLTEISTAQAEGRTDRVQALTDQLRREVWDTTTARDFAVRSGWNLKAQAEKAEGLERVRLLDRARRLLSRGVYAASSYAADGAPKPERATLVEAIQAMNTQVMRFGPGLPGVTRSYKVPPGIAPVQIVSREKLPYGHNALLYWNKGGQLDPTRLRAEETLLLPEEEVSILVLVDRKVLAVFCGDWFVKEFRVGTGKPESPTPRGQFTVMEKHENPDWWSPNGLIPFGDPRNELGAAWIPIVNDEHPSSYGIHGTKAPQTVGTACSNGCVRLRDEEVREVFWWVRTASAGGKATRVTIL